MKKTTRNLKALTEWVTKHKALTIILSVVVTVFLILAYLIIKEFALLILVIGIFAICEG